MAKRIGTVEPCPSQLEDCAGHFKRASAAQIRCNVCTKSMRNHRSKVYQRKRRASPELYREISNEEAIKRNLDKSRGYKLHPCWCCGQPTKRRALCDVCYEGDGKKNHGSEGTCYINRQQLEKVEQRLRSLLKEKMLTYSCDEYTQEELWKMVPSNGKTK